MLLEELIEMLQEIEEEYGGEIEVRSGGSMPRGEVVDVEYRENVRTHRDEVVIVCE